LAIIEEDSSGSRLICLEEPENGINPKKIYEMVELLEGMATDTEIAVDEDNPLRQVIINTHSPIVVSCVPDDSLYLAKGKERYDESFGKKIQYTGFSAMQDTWKTIHNLADVTSKGEILSYLDKTIFEKSPTGSMIAEKEAVYLKKNDLQKRRSVAQNIIQTELDFEC
jgi:predicted ATP-dependent endonuclease of OLD family